MQIFTPCSQRFKSWFLLMLDVVHRSQKPDWELAGIIARLEISIISQTSKEGKINNV